MVACEAVAGLRIDCGAILSDASILNGRIGLVEIRDRQIARDHRHRRRLFRLRYRARCAGRDIQSASSSAGKTVDGGVSSRSAFAKKPVPMREIRTGAGETGTAYIE